MNIETNMNVMKKLLYTSITTILLLGILFSCTDEDYKLYNPSLTNKIYFEALFEINEKNMMLSDINTRGVIFFSTDFISTFKRIK